MTKLGLKDCRPEVLSFALLMERELRQNDHKAGWKDDCPDTLSERVEEEAEELRLAAINWMGHVAHSERPLREAVAEEAADVANMAMMVADVCAALPPPPDVASLNHAETLRALVAAWESLPGGRFYSPKVVEAWMIGQMAPAIDVARAKLAESAAS